MIELTGYLFVAAFLAAWSRIFRRPILNEQYAVAFLLASLGWGTLVNVFAVLVGAWRFRYGLADRLQRGLLPFNRRRDVLILLGYAVLENFFWRPLTLYWRLRGLWDAWRGKSGWEKFARQGFQKHPEAGPCRLSRAGLRILVVDDDPRCGRLVATACATAGYGQAAWPWRPAREALAAAAGARPRSCSTTSSRTPPGWTCCPRSAPCPNQPAVILVTAHGDEALAARALRAGRGRLPDQGRLAARACCPRSSSGCAASGRCARRWPPPSGTWCTPNGWRPSASST